MHNALRVLPWLRPSLAIALIAALASTTYAENAVPVRSLFCDPERLASWLADHDPQVAAARARRDAAVAAGEQAEVLPNPQLNASVGGFVLGATNPNRPRLGLDETTNVSLGISQLVEIGKRGPRQQAAGLRAEEAGALATGTLGNRIGDAMTTLGKLTYVSARRAAVAANLDAARTLQRLEQIRHDHADLSGADLARIQLDTQQLELQLGRADADVATAAAACAALLHSPCATGDLDAAALDAGAPLPATMPSDVRAIDDALAQRAARVASRFEIRALDADATLAERRAVPDVTLGVGYTYDNLTVAGNQGQTAMLSLSIPLPFFDRGAHDAAVARANARAAAADDQAATQQARGELAALRAQRNTLEATLATLESTSVPRSAQIVEQTRRAFDLGQAGLAELLLAERAHRELLLEVLDTRFDLFGVRVLLRQSLGLDDQVARAARRAL